MRSLCRDVRGKCVVSPGLCDSGTTPDSLLGPTRTDPSSRTEDRVLRRDSPTRPPMSRHLFPKGLDSTTPRVTPPDEVRDLRRGAHPNPRQGSVTSQTLQVCARPCAPYFREEISSVCQSVPRENSPHTDNGCVNPKTVSLSSSDYVSVPTSVHGSTSLYCMLVQIHISLNKVP